MRTRTNCFLTLIPLAVLATASAQMQDDPNATAYTIKFTSLPFVEQRVVKGAPYSGREVELHFRTLADGSRLILYQTERLVYRDSAGRLRSEAPPRAASLVNQEPPGQFLLVRIDDPVSGYHYVLDPVNRVAHRFIPRRVGSAPAPARGARAPSASPRFQVPARGTKVQTELLGVRMISGVTATGERRIQTNPEEAQPFMPPEYVFETWTHEQTGVVLLRKTSGSRMGEQMTTVEDFRVGEPDPGLFRPPSDYKIQDETGPFSIVIPYKEGAAQPTRTANNTQEPAGGTNMALLIHKEDPEYTPEAQAAKIQGVVIIRIEIGTDGTPRVLGVIKSLDPGLDQKAVEAVSKWRFRPATRNGTLISQEANVEVNFRRLDAGQSTDR